MSKLSKLVGKGEKVKLGEIEVEIKPLTVSSMPLLMELADEDTEKQAKAMMDIIKQTLNDCVPDATDEEIDNLPLEHMMTLMEVITRINKIEMDEDKKALLERIKK